jgi:hypothetical protein
MHLPGVGTRFCLTDALGFNPHGIPVDHDQTTIRPRSDHDQIMIQACRIQRAASRGSIMRLCLKSRLPSGGYNGG